MTRDHLLATRLLNSPEYQKVKQQLLETIQDSTQSISGIRGATSEEIRKAYLEMIRDYGKTKGRDQYFNYLSSGIGRGPFVELMDGSVKLDLITGIGINYFGHSHPELMSELVDAVTSDTMQGNLQPGIEAQEIIAEILKHVGSKSRIRMAWPFSCGTMCNESALKIIRQKKFPASRIFAFEDCFAGRSTAMAEITDSPGYRQGQPVYGEVHHLPFYQASLGLEASVEKTLSAMKSELARYPGKYAGLMIEPIQGEGGIRMAPREWYVRIFEVAKAANLAIWMDEVQSFGRTEQLFAYRMLELEEYVDVVTVGKLLHTCMALWTEEMNPKPGLIAGTFTGSAASHRTGRRILEILTSQGYYGPQGTNIRLGDYFRGRLQALREGSCKGRIGEIRGVGGMIGFMVLSGSMEDTKKVLMELFDQGVIAFYAGHDPYLIRILPPFGVMKESEIDLAISVIEKVLLKLSP